jgi:hypothetical protein
MPIHDQAENEAALTRLCDSLMSNRMVGVVGAGLSNWAGYDTWDAVLGRLGDAVTAVTGNANVATDIRRLNTNKLFQAQRLGDRLGETAFQEFIRREFALPGKPLHQVLKNFANLPIPHILTLNFDLSCELAHDAVGIPYRALSTADPQAQLTFLAECNSLDALKMILHLHGIFTDPIGSIALHYQRYHSLYTNTLLKKLIWSIYMSRPILFAGFSFTDHYYCQELRTCADDVRHALGLDAPNRHFAILQVPFNSETDERIIRQTFANEYLVDAVFYERRNAVDPLECHGGFAELIHELVQRLNLVVPIAVLPTAIEGQNPPSDEDEAQRERLVVQMINRVEREREQ